MESLPPSDVLKVPENLINYLRKKYNLDKPGVIDECVDILEAWMKKQYHFRKTDFSKRYLEVLIIVCKGSLERAKEKLDKLCTMKTFLPQFFIGYDVKEVLVKSKDIIKFSVSRNVTDDGNRLMTFKIIGDKFDQDFCLNTARFHVCVAEFVKKYDYADGGYIMFDFRDSHLKEAMFNVNVMDVHHSATIMLQGYAFRIKGIHVLTKSFNKFQEFLIGLLKKALGPKIGGRMMVHYSMEKIYERVPKCVIPKDYGGEAESLDFSHSKWMAALTTDKFLEYFEEMRVASTDESLRQNPSSNQCIGLPGTFRMLSVD